MLKETSSLFGTFVVADSEVVSNAHQLLAQARYEQFKTMKHGKVQPTYGKRKIANHVQTRSVIAINGRKNDLNTPKKEVRQKLKQTK